MAVDLQEFLLIMGAAATVAGVEVRLLFWLHDKRIETRLDRMESRLIDTLRFSFWSAPKSKQDEFARSHPKTYKRVILGDNGD